MLDAKLEYFEGPLRVDSGPFFPKFYEEYLGEVLRFGVGAGVPPHETEYPVDVGVEECAEGVGIAVPQLGKQFAGGHARKNMGLE
jgi:hypothetical protein